MSALAARTGAINLGQGFPDEDGPAEVLETARDAIANGVNQYPPGRGIPDLLSAIASRYRAEPSSEAELPLDFPEAEPEPNARP